MSKNTNNDNRHTSSSFFSGDNGNHRDENEKEENEEDGDNNNNSSHLPDESAAAAGTGWNDKTTSNSNNNSTAANTDNANANASINTTVKISSADAGENLPPPDEIKSIQHQLTKTHQAMIKAAHSGNFIAASQHQSSLQSTLQTLATQMKSAAQNGDYIKAGQLQTLFGQASSMVENGGVHHGGDGGGRNETGIDVGVVKAAAEQVAKSYMDGMNSKLDGFMEHEKHRHNHQQNKEVQHVQTQTVGQTELALSEDGQQQHQQQSISVSMEERESTSSSSSSPSHGISSTMRQRSSNKLIGIPPSSSVQSQEQHCCNNNNQEEDVEKQQRKQRKVFSFSSTPHHLLEQLRPLFSMIPYSFQHYPPKWRRKGPKIKTCLSNTTTTTTSQQLKKNMNQRWRTRILAFIVLVAYDVHKSIVNDRAILVHDIDGTLMGKRRQLQQQHQLQQSGVASVDSKTQPHLQSGGSSFLMSPIKVNHIHTIPSTDNEGGVHTDVNSANSTTSSATASKKANNYVRISFSLHDPSKLPFQSLYAPANKACHIGDLTRYLHGGQRTGILPPSLMLGGTLDSHRNNPTHIDIESSGGRVLDFTATISTNLKILNIGDSISIQIAQALDEMMGASELNSRSLLWESWNDADGGTLVAPTRGGGINGAWRMTGLLSQERQGLHQMAVARNAHAHGLAGGAGGWNFHQVNPFLRHVYKYHEREIKVGKIDVAIFRVQHGWMDIKEITRNRIIEAAEMAKKILYVSTIIFITVPFTNNVATVEIMDGVRKVNDMIWDVARTWHTTRTKPNHDTTMLVMDYATFTNQLLWANAIDMGYNVTSPLLHHGNYEKQQEVFAKEGPTFLLQRLNNKVFPPSIPQVCTKQPTKESGGMYCDRNILINDGMHFCTETLSARIGAATACLLGCAFNGKEDVTDKASTKSDADADTENQESQLRDCERQCNEQFMSVMGVRNSWIGSNKNLASFAAG